MGEEGQKEGRESEVSQTTIRVYFRKFDKRGGTAHTRNFGG